MVKTTRLIKESHDKWLYIVCANTQRAKNISDIAGKLNIDIPYPIVANESPIRSSFIDKVLVDDLEDVLQHLINKEIVIATTSCDIDQK